MVTLYAVRHPLQQPLQVQLVPERESALAVSADAGASSNADMSDGADDAAERGSSAPLRIEIDGPTPSPAAVEQEREAEEEDVVRASCRGIVAVST